MVRWGRTLDRILHPRKVLAANAAAGVAAAAVAVEVVAGECKSAAQASADGLVVEPARGPGSTFAVSVVRLVATAELGVAVWAGVEVVRLVAGTVVQDGIVEVAPAGQVAGDITQAMVQKG